MAAVVELGQQDWVQQLMQGSTTQGITKQHVDPKMVFPFQDAFLVGTMHGANANKAANPNVNKAVEIQDGNDDVNILRTKTAGVTQLEVIVGSRVASGSNPVSGPTANSTQPRAASGGSEDPSSIGPSSGTVGGLNDE
jgi:hypothetical protein